MVEAGQSYSYGREFLQNIREVEEAWEAGLLGWIASTSPNDVPDLFDKLGETLSYLDRISSCVWGCEEVGDDHLERHMTARIASNARAAIKLLLGGYLGEAMSIIRGMQEVASLMHLFMESESDREQFRTQSVHGRESDFSHRKVARRIRMLKGDNSDLLSEYATLSEKQFRLYSQGFTHFTEAWSPPTLSTSETADFNEIFARAAILSGLAAVAAFVSTAANFATDLFEQIDERKAVMALILELIETTTAYRSVAQSQLRSV